MELWDSSPAACGMEGGTFRFAGYVALRPSTILIVAHTECRVSLLSWTVVARPHQSCRPKNELVRSRIIALSLLFPRNQRENSQTDIRVRPRGARLGVLGMGGRGDRDVFAAIRPREVVRTGRRTDGRRDRVHQASATRFALGRNRAVASHRLRSNRPLRFAARNRRRLAVAAALRSDPRALRTVETVVQPVFTCGVHRPPCPPHRRPAAKSSARWADSLGRRAKQSATARRVAAGQSPTTSVEGPHQSRGFRACPHGCGVRPAFRMRSPDVDTRDPRVRAAGMRRRD